MGWLKCWIKPICWARKSFPQIFAECRILVGTAKLFQPRRITIICGRLTRRSSRRITSPYTKLKPNHLRFWCTGSSVSLIGANRLPGSRSQFVSQIFRGNGCLPSLFDSTLLLGDFLLHGVIPLRLLQKRFLTCGDRVCPIFLVVIFAKLRTIFVSAEIRNSLSCHCLISFFVTPRNRILQPVPPTV